ncbi:MAG: hypothetical protein JO208_04830 [Alphaproteobacteria bacterium]|nr:hypothetical protein [Alphaproteobacteria bacterium]
MRSCLATAMVAAPWSSASAGQWHHHRCWFIGCVFDAAGAVVVGAATIATAPLAIVADAAGDGSDRGRPPGYGPPPGYAAAYPGGPWVYTPSGYYRYPRRYFRRRWYGPPTGY